MLAGYFIAFFIGLGVMGSIDAHKELWSTLLAIPLIILVDVLWTLWILRKKRV